MGGVKKGAPVTIDGRPVKIVILPSKALMKRRQALADDIINLVDDSGDLTHSDIQGIAEAIAMTHLKEAQ